MTDTKTTCQICERAIKAKKGVIAHHGYQRPQGQGWQTESCFGARYEPYEISDSAMRPYIDHVRSYVAVQETALKELMENPPETITDDRFHWVAPENRTTHTRPEGFDAKKNLESYYSNGYEGAHKGRAEARIYQIKQGKAEIERMEARLAAWKPL